MKKPTRRKAIPDKTRTEVLTESGYRCGVPTCRTILLLDLHHLDEVAAGGGNEASNLIPLCPNCHALYHRGTMKAESVYAYKSMLVSLTRAFDVETVDRLLFLASCKKDFLIVSGDGLLHFSRLIASGLATVAAKSNNNSQIVTYAVNASETGRQLVRAWELGDRERLNAVVSKVPPDLVADAAPTESAKPARTTRVS